MIHVEVAERVGLTARLGEGTMTIVAQGKWYIEDWLSLMIETMGSSFSDYLMYHGLTDDKETWVFRLPEYSHDTGEHMCRR